MPRERTGEHATAVPPERKHLQESLERCHRTAQTREGVRCVEIWLNNISVRLKGVFEKAFGLAAIRTSAVCRGALKNMPVTPKGVIEKAKSLYSIRTSRGWTTNVGGWSARST